jgi:hypothetical protein
MRDGAFWGQSTPVRRIDGSESGSWPTPDVRGFTNEGSLAMLKEMVVEREEFMGMAYRQGSGREERLWPTPVASEGADCGSTWEALAKIDKGGRIQRRIATDGGPETQQTQRAQLNPAWVEWLIGWPIGWTDCDASAMGKFQAWCASHGAPYPKKEVDQ